MLYNGNHESLRETYEGAVVSLVAQDIFGGTLLRANLTDSPFALMKYHYINRLPKGEHKDFTAAQFGQHYPTSLVFEDRTRDQALEHPDTVARYKLFQERFWNSI